MFKAVCACKTASRHRLCIIADKQLLTMHSEAGLAVACSTADTLLTPVAQKPCQAVASMLHSTSHQSKAEHCDSTISALW